MNATDRRTLGKQALVCALLCGIWFAPIPAGLTREAWHLFAMFAAAIVSIVVNAFPLLTASLLATHIRPWRTPRRLLPSHPCGTTRGSQRSAPEPDLWCQGHISHFIWHTTSLRIWMSHRSGINTCETPSEM